VIFWPLGHLRNLYLHLVIANDLSLAIGSIRVDWKVRLMQLRPQFNSYNLMHKQDKKINKTQGRWLDASGLDLITTMLASSQLDACGPSNTHRTCSAWNSDSGFTWSTRIYKRWQQLTSVIHGVQSAIWCMIMSILILLTFTNYFTNLPIAFLIY
jgi:hypothetical protein